MATNNKSDIQTLLAEVMQRLDRIELILKANANKLDLIDMDNWSDSDSTNQLNTVKQKLVYSDSGSDLVMETYDSENEFPCEHSEIYAEPKLTLTPHQIQMLNDEFQQYKISGLQSDQDQD